MKKSNAHAVLNQLLIHALVLICVGGTVGLSRVYLRHRIAVTANATKGFEYEFAQVERDLAEVNTQIARERSPAALEHKNAQFRLLLAQPTEAQILRIDESPEDRLAAKRNIQRFATEAAGGSAAVRFQVVDLGRP